jgi:predicted nucleic acid-binding protein
MTHGYAIDTSILVRLVTGHPPEVAESLYSELEKRHRNGNRFFADSMVIAEAYVAIQHHYAIRKAEVRTSLTDLLEKGITAQIRNQR